MTGGPAPIPAKRFYDGDIQGLTAYGPGAFIWSKRGKPRLIILVPHNGPAGFEVIAVNVREWGFPSGKHSKDSNYERPTITGSIVGRDWHGRLKGGYLVAA